MVNLGDKMTEHSKIQSQLNEAEKQEKKIYEALAALINYIKGVKKYQLKTPTDFPKFKKDILEAVAKFEVKKHKASGCELKFNVKHYERAMKCASDTTYRDMAIQAANKDLNQEAMNELVIALSKDCREATRLVKSLSLELDKIERARKESPQLFSNVVEPAVEEETESARA